MKFKSKIDWWMHAMLTFFALLVFYGVYMYITTKNTDHLSMTIPVVFICGAIILPVYFFNHYTIDDDKLLIRSGYFKKTLEIKHIKVITPTYNPMNSAALSNNKIALYYNSKKRDKLRSEFISPLEKDSFISELLKINPDIVIKNG